MVVGRFSKLEPCRTLLGMTFDFANCAFNGSDEAGMRDNVEQIFSLVLLSSLGALPKGNQPSNESLTMFSQVIVWHAFI